MKPDLDHLLHDVIEALEISVGYVALVADGTGKMPILKSRAEKDCEILGLALTRLRAFVDAVTGEPSVFNKERMAKSPDYPKMKEMILLLIECRDALPAISDINARLHGVDLTLADRIERCLEPWKTTVDDPEGI
jgi:hypothetical protein